MPRIWELLFDAFGKDVNIHTLLRILSSCCGFHIPGVGSAEVLKEGRPFAEQQFRRKLEPARETLTQRDVERYRERKRQQQNRRKDKEMK